MGGDGGKGRVKPGHEERARARTGGRRPAGGGTCTSARRQTCKSGAVPRRAPGGTTHDAEARAQRDARGDGAHLLVFRNSIERLHVRWLPTGGRAATPSPPAFENLRNWPRTTTRHPGCATGAQGRRGHPYQPYPLPAPNPGILAPPLPRLLTRHSLVPRRATNAKAKIFDRQ